MMNNTNDPLMQILLSRALQGQGGQQGTMPMGPGMLAGPPPSPMGQDPNGPPMGVDPNGPPMGGPPMGGPPPAPPMGGQPPTGAPLTGQSPAGGFYGRSQRGGSGVGGPQ